jgi:hypothetical protein
MALTRERKAIVLRKLANDSALELNAMVTELCNGDTAGRGETPKSARWNRRFSASGKNECTGAPRVRLA